MIASFIDYTLYALFFSVIAITVMKTISLISLFTSARASLKHIKSTITADGAALRAARDAALKSALSGLPVLYVLAQIAPFVGLMGTVLRIQMALTTLSSTSGLAEIAHPVGAALHSTFLGLLCAIPAVAAYGLFKAAAAHLDATFQAQADLLVKGSTNSTTPAAGEP